MRSFFILPDLCRTLYPQALCVRNAQHRARFLSSQHQVRLPKQSADVGARIVACHRMVGIAK